MMNTKELNALRNVLEHALEDESEHYWEGYEQNLDHIYHDYLILQEFYDDQTNSESKEEQRPDWRSQGDGNYGDWIEKLERV